MLTQGKTASTREAIPADEVSFHPHSFADSDGRLFRWNGELYRGISAEQTPFFRKLFSDGLIGRLAGKGLLIETEPTPYAMGEYPMVVRHKHLPFGSYPNEWCAAMLKDAALTIIDLVIELATHGLTLKDAHPWNVLFDDCKPIFVDMTSIVPMKDDSTWAGFDEFSRFCYFPLVLMSHGQERIARSLLSEYNGVLRAEVLQLMRSCVPSKFAMSKLIRRLLNPVRPFLGNDSSGLASKLRFLGQVRADIERMATTHGPELRRVGADSSGGEARDLKQRHLRDILTKLRPSSVLDIGSGSGWRSRLSARLGSRVVAFDSEPKCVTRLYQEARADGSMILPLVMDFVKPTPSVGYSGHYSVAATERLRCDMVLALGLTDTLVFDRFLTFDLIAEGLALFSKRWLVVEFIPPDGPGLEKRGSYKPSWYALDGFVKALRKRFREVEVISLDPVPGALLSCEK